MAMHFRLQLHSLFLLVFLVLHASSCEQEDYWNMKLPKVPMPSAIKDNLFHFYDEGEGQNLENKATVDQPFTITAWKYDTNKAKGQKLEKKASVNQPFTVTAWKYDTEKAKDQKLEKKAGVDQPFTVTAWKYDTNHNGKDQMSKVKSSVDQPFTITAWKYETDSAKDQKVQEKASVDQPFTITAWKYDADSAKGQQVQKKASVDQPYTVFSWKYKADLATDQKLEERANVDQPFTVTAWKYDMDNVQHHHHHAMHNNENINDAQQDLRAGSIFFMEKSLRLGMKLKHDFQMRPKIPFLPQHIAHSIPFSMDRITDILNLFSIKSDSGEATAVKETLSLCLHRPKVKKENRTCAQSMEDIVDFVVGELGTNDVELRMMRNDIEVINGINDYVITKVKKLVVPGNNAVACHRMSYPYVVYYCHHQQDIGHYDVTLVNPTSGTTIQTTAVCHYDTYAWQADVLALRYLGIRPGDAPVCHFSAINDMFWTIKDYSKSLDMAM